MAKQIILHIGQPKTGTTSLQYRLANQREQMRERGINYPALTMNDFNHRCLGPAIFESDRYSANILLRMGGDKQSVEKESRAQWAAVHRTRRDETLILSAENFFQVLNEKSGNNLKEALSMGENHNYRILAYIRNPAERYLSFVQEQLKIINRIMAIKAYPFMPVLKSYKNVFGDKLEVRLYERRHFPNGDVFGDFVDWLDVGENLIDRNIADPKPNRSLSAEAMYVLSRLQGRTRDKTQDEAKLNRQKINALNQLDRQISGATKPKLKPEVMAFIERNSPELLELRDEFGLSFSDFNYDNITDGRESEKKGVSSLGEICDFDLDRS